MTVTIDKFGRVLIPKPLRDRLGLRPGTPLELGVRDVGDGAPALELRPGAGQSALVREGPLLVHQGRLAEADLDVAEILRRQREERARRHAGSDEDAR